MYVNKNVREITNDTVPLPTKSYAEFSGNGIKDKLDDTKDFNANNYFRNAWQEGFVGITKINRRRCSLELWYRFERERHNDQFKMLLKVC